MFAKKKKELTEEQKHWLEVINVLRERVHQLDSDWNFSRIGERSRNERASQILTDLEKLEREINGFDDFMGHPMDMLEEIF